MSKNVKVKVGTMAGLSKLATAENVEQLLPAMLTSVTVRPAKLMGLANNGWKMQQYCYSVAAQNPDVAMVYLTDALNNPNQAVQEVAAGVIEMLVDNKEDASLAEELFKGIKDANQGRRD